MDITVNPRLFYIAAFIPFFLLSLGIHEFAHAFSAYKLGDDTAKQHGRLTLNPIKHLDLFGSIIIPAISLISGYAVIGWAKPVPVNPNNFKNPRRDDIIVSAMGPISNLIFAFVIFVFAKNFGGLKSDLFNYLYMPFFFNVFLFYFNLLPIPPLDGSHVLNNLLPAELSHYYRSAAKWSLVILMIFIYSPLWKYFISIVDVTARMILNL
jgi:Zn-dependent protease